jgi:predicted transcriptional regulator
MYKHKAIDTKTWSYDLPEASREWTKHECQIEPDLYQYLEDVGATNSPVTSTLSRFGDSSKEQVGSLWETLKQMVVSERENRFIKDLLQIQVGLQQAASLLLIENVKRQASFVDKMHNHIWICSPAVGGTMRRAIDRYNKFLKLFILYPGKTLVPTLDIDLVWHTHQCSAISYEETMRARTGRYINHDDKIGKEKLGHGADETSHLFRTRFGQEYSVCLCWDCEMLITALEKIDEEGDLLVDDLDMADIAKQVAKYVVYYRSEELSRRVDRKMEV